MKWKNIVLHIACRVWLSIWYTLACQLRQMMCTFWWASVISNIAFDSIQFHSISCYVNGYLYFNRHIRTHTHKCAHTRTLLLTLTQISWDLVSKLCMTLCVCLVSEILRKIINKAFVLPAPTSFVLQVEWAHQSSKKVWYVQMRQVVHHTQIVWISSIAFTFNRVHLNQYAFLFQSYVHQNSKCYRHLIRWVKLFFLPIANEPKTNVIFPDKIAVNNSLLVHFYLFLMSA